MSSSGKSKKLLTLEDREIWGRLTKTAEPLSDQKRNYSDKFFHEFEAELQKQLLPDSVTKLQSSSAPVFQPSVEKKPILTMQYLDLKTTRKISKGKTSIDGKLDLHGYHQKDAHHILYDYIENAYYSGKRTVLIITGKGNLGRGVLRENVPKWLATAKFRLLISGYSQSHAVHGGDGAFYIKIRRKR